MSYPPKYLNPFTDFGFKKIFGTEASKPLLIDFLNAVLQLADPIKDLSFCLGPTTAPRGPGRKNLEQLGSSDLERKAIYDIFCESEKGEKFIVELQNANQKFSKDRIVYDATFPIKKQGEKEGWNSRLTPVYCVKLLNFRFQDDILDKNPQVLRRVQLKDQNNRVFYRKLMLIYIEMPNFTLGPESLKDRKDQWLYFLKHLEKFESISDLFEDKIFEQVFEIATLTSMDNEDRIKYQKSLKMLRRQQEEIEELERELQEELERGAFEAKFRIAQELQKADMKIDQIIEITGLTWQELEGL
jgi:predicted transposase/invertase (TIGR01784 family)